MGLHFHSHNKAKYVEQGKEEGRLEGAALGKSQAVDAHNAKNPYDRLNTELELHILTTKDYVQASEDKKKVSDAALALRQAVHDLRHPLKKQVVFKP